MELRRRHHNVPVVPPCADCCDGSDEPAGRCKNTCAQEGAAARNAMKAKLKVWRAACRDVSSHKLMVNIAKALRITEAPSHRPTALTSVGRAASYGPSVAQRGILRCECG